MSGNGSSNGTSSWCSEFETEALCYVINGIGNIAGTIAVVSCIFIIAQIVKTKKYKSPSHRVILYTTGGLLLQSIRFAWTHIVFATDDKYYEFCIFQAFCVHLTSAIVLGWMCVVTFNVVWIGVLFKTPGWKLELAEFIIAMVPAVLISLIPLLLGDYGPSGFWCWIITTTEDGETSQRGIALQFATFYAPNIIGNIIVALVLILSACIIQKRLRSSKACGGASYEYQEKLWREDIRFLMLLPWLIIAFWLPPLVNRIRLAANFGRDIPAAHFFFWFLHSFSRPLQVIVFAGVIIGDMIRSSKKKSQEREVSTETNTM